MILLFVSPAKASNPCLGRIPHEEIHFKQGRHGGFAPGRGGFLVGKGWNQADSLCLAGEGVALSRFQWTAGVAEC